MEKATKEDIKLKLNYLGLDLENIPDFLSEFNGLNFNTSRFNNDKDHRVFKFVPINKIDILITPSLRSDDMKKKYSDALPLSKYLTLGDEEEDVERYNTFLRMIKRFSISDVENISMAQMKLDKSEPFRVKYDKSSLWQIYYSEAMDRYFMLVCTEERTFSEFFYLIKKKIEFSKKKSKTVPRIYVPINYMNYSEAILNVNEIVDLENYLWVLTKNWCLFFEVYNKKDELSLQIIGDTFVYENLKSTYKIKLTNKEDAIKFYKLIKAGFIMQTEIKKYFQFTTKMDSKSNLELYLGNTRLTYDNLTDFIKTEFDKAKEGIYAENNNIKGMKEKLDNLKDSVGFKEKEYYIKQREISTYLECRKTFLGKMKYYFKSSKKSNAKNEENIEKTKNEISNENETLNIHVEEKEYYTLDDLVSVYSLLEKSERACKDLNQDIKAMELKLNNINSKVKNANLYIEEIDKHKKSIFDFWKFANKDEKLSLEIGGDSEKETTTNSFKKVFNFEMDFEHLGANVDNIQRKKLSREEIESLFIAKTEILNILNTIRCNKLDKHAIEEELDNLKEEFNKNRLYIDTDTFDVFGNIEADSRTIKYIGNKSHRENEKSKFKILNINKKIDVFDFTEKLHSILNFIEGSISKITSSYNMPIYKLVPITDNIQEQCFQVFNINVEKELEDYQDNGEGALNLIKLNIKEGTPLLYYSNIIFYDNNNQTLPEGMDLSTNVLIDCRKFEFNLINKTKFRTNNYFTESDNLILPKSKDIFVYEYDLN